MNLFNREKSKEIDKNSRFSKTTKFNIGTFNVRGIRHAANQEALCNDLTKYDLELICLQETRCGNFEFTDKEKEIFELSKKKNTNMAWVLFIIRMLHQESPR